MAKNKKGKSKSAKKKSVKNYPEFNKHWYYEKSVQNPANEVEFFNEKYKEIRNRKPITLREDFCGTAAISCEWVKQSAKHRAWGIDLDPEPVDYGKENHRSPLTDKQQTQIEYLLDNVLTAKTPKVDVCFAFNFSYFIFKKRRELLAYLKVARESLADDGVFFMDLFGGPDSQTVMTDEIEHSHWSYFWECQSFNPITNDCRFAIHFKREGEKKRRDEFIYEWRMWTMQELRDLLDEAGFSKTIAYWEGDDDENEDYDDGEFYATEEAENCDAWVTYIAALK